MFDLTVSRGNILVVIEHNLDVMKQTDWIDLYRNPADGKRRGISLDLFRILDEQRAEKARQDQHVCARPEGDISLSACHILLVEDNELNREIAKMIRRYEEERDKGVLILFSFTNAER